MVPIWDVNHRTQLGHSGVPALFWPLLQLLFQNAKKKLEIDISCANSYDIVILQGLVGLTFDELVSALNHGFGARLTTSEVFFHGCERI